MRQILLAVSTVLCCASVSFAIDPSSKNDPLKLQARVTQLEKETTQLKIELEQLKRMVTANGKSVAPNSFGGPLPTTQSWGSEVGTFTPPPLPDRAATIVATPKASH